MRWRKKCVNNSYVLRNNTDISAEWRCPFFHLKQQMGEAQQEWQGHVESAVGGLTHQNA
jgi:hypothetical protein